MRKPPPQTSLHSPAPKKNFAVFSTDPERVLMESREPGCWSIVDEDNIQSFVDVNGWAGQFLRYFLGESEDIWISTMATFSGYEYQHIMSRGKAIIQAGSNGEEGLYADCFHGDSGLRRALS
ncbi:MAG: hypothetical protein ACE5KI_03450 [Dehalococcoidia bacterium]